jgi:hypothetical protein
MESQTVSSALLLLLSCLIYPITAGAVKNLHSKDVTPPLHSTDTVGAAGVSCTGSGSHLLSENEATSGILHVLLLQVVHVRNKGTLLLDECTVSLTVGRLGVEAKVWQAVGRAGQDNQLWRMPQTAPQQLQCCQKGLVWDSSYHAASLLVCYE